MQNLTTKQQLVYDMIRNAIQTVGYPPTSRELADNLGVTQTAAVNYINALVKKGKITRVPFKSRTIALVNETTT